MSLWTGYPPISKDDFALGCFDGTPLYEDPDSLRGEHPDCGTYISPISFVANASYWINEFLLQSTAAGRRRVLRALSGLQPRGLAAP